MISQNDFILKHGLGSEHVSSFSKILDLYCSIKTIHVGELMCKEGEHATELFFLLDGEVEIIKERVPETIVVLKAPSIIGHLAMIDSLPRSASCLAKTNVTVAIMNKRHFEDLVGRWSIVGDVLRRLLLSSMSNQLTRGNIMLRELLSTGIDPNPNDLIIVKKAFKGM